MGQIDKRGPQWEAPPTLLPRVLAGIGQRGRCEIIPFFTWPWLIRINLVLLSLAVLLVGMWYARGIFDTLVGGESIAYAFVKQAFEMASIITSIVEKVMQALTFNTGGLVLLIIIGVLMCIVWLATAAGLVYLFKIHRTGRAA